MSRPSGEGCNELEHNGETGALELRAGVIHLSWDCGLVVTGDAARQVMARVNALCYARRKPLLVTSVWMEALSHAARNVFAGNWPLTRIAVMGTSPVDKVIFVFYAARHRPVCPTQFFTSEADAMRWLKSPARAVTSLSVPRAEGSRG